MKRILILILLTLPFLVQGQNVSWKFFDHYSKADGFSSVQLERKMMRMMSRQAAEKGDEKLAELLNGIEWIRIVALNGGDGQQFMADAEELATDPFYRFQLVLSESSDGQMTRFYLREAEFSRNSELLMITSGPREMVVVNIYGLFDLKQVSRLSSIRPKSSPR